MENRQDEGENSEDEQDLGYESAYQKTMWEQLQQQHAELQQMQSLTVDMTRPHRLDTKQHTSSNWAASDEESGRIKLSPRRKQYYSYSKHGYSTRQRDLTLHSPVSETASHTPVTHNSNSNPTTHPVDFIELNRLQLKERHKKKFIYPQKTYTEMFNKKKQSSVGYTNVSNKNVFGGSSTFLPHEAKDKSGRQVRSLEIQRSPKLPQYQYFVNGQAMLPYVQQHHHQVLLPQKYTVLPPISGYRAQPLHVWPASSMQTPQRVSVDITLRLPQNVVPGHVTLTPRQAPAGSMMTSSQLQGAPAKRPAFIH